jgi:hypothetical protein
LNRNEEEVVMRTRGVQIEGEESRRGGKKEWYIEEMGV